MTHHGTMLHTYPAWAIMRDRCRDLGLITWRCETDGTLVECPEDPGLASLWMSSAPVRRLVAEAAEAWSGTDEPRLRSGAPGLRLIPIIHEHRGRRMGMTIAAALEPQIVDGVLFEEACRATGLDIAGTRAAFRRIATFTEASAQRHVEMLRWMARDLEAVTEHESALSGFASELSQSYETIDMLYALGRSMRNLDRPSEFFQTLFDRLKETLPFGWLAARLCEDRTALAELAGRCVLRGAVPWSIEELPRIADEFQSQLGADARTMVAAPDQASGQEARVLVQPILVGGKVVGMMFCGDRRGDDPQVSSYDMQLFEAASAFTGAFLENARLYREQQATFMGALKALTAAIDAKDRYTCGHSERVAYLGRTLARAVGLPEEQAERVHLSGLLHDVGKIGVPEAVLCKPGKLTDAEFEAIKRHPQIGHDILQGIPMLADILPGVLYHHERFDGRGYPHGIAGTEIPLVARILAIADTFDAMSSTRSYRSALPRGKVMEEMRRCAGAQFDPELVAAFVQLDLSTYDAMVERHASEYRPRLEVPSLAA